MKINTYHGKGVLAYRLESGIAISVLTHMIAGFLIISIPRTVPPAKLHLPLCNVSIISEKNLPELKINGKPAEILSEKPGMPEHQKKFPAKPVLKPKLTKSDERIKKSSTPPQEKTRIKTGTVRPLLKNSLIKAEIRPAEIQTGNTANSASAVSDDSRGKTTGDSGDGSPSATDGHYEASFGSDGGPGFIRKVVPRYPKRAQERGREGVVVLMVTVNESGHPVDVTVIKSAGFGFDEEAVKAVRESTFSPALRNGKPVACRAQLPINFVLD